MKVELPIYKKDGTESGEKLILEEAAFTIEPNYHAIYLAVKVERANNRQGTHSTKTRAEVSGGGRKPWRQKGTGRARVGSIRSPLWVGGGVAFGPKPRDYSLKINKKVKRLARRSALAYKYIAEAIKVVENLDFDQPRARNIRELLTNFGLMDKKVTILVYRMNRNIALSCRNFYNISLLEARNASTYDLLDNEVILFEPEGLKELNEQLLATG
ncbi:MAG TPA: 50S ribosomal protein L4 [Candidatus Marinimicrobia bacterium]|nr:50S ribosomal protein L4 [Candidatus Neomarinimicrobiota bacterium]